MNQVQINYIQAVATHTAINHAFETTNAHLEGRALRLAKYANNELAQARMELSNAKLALIAWGFDEIIKLDEAIGNELKQGYLNGHFTADALNNWIEATLRF